MYCGTFKILAKVGSVAYQLSLPPNIKVHNVFHVSILKRYIHDNSHVIDWNVIQVEPKGEFQVGPSIFSIGENFYSGTIPSENSRCNGITLVQKKLLGS